MSEADVHLPSAGDKAAKTGQAAGDLELSASGFVGMLSRRHVREPDPLGAPLSAPPARHHGTFPTPKPVAHASPLPSPPTVSARPSGTAPAAAPRSQGTWFHLLMPSFYMLGLLLITTGIWAALAVYSLATHQNFVPLVNLDDPHIHKIFYGLLAGIPLGMALMIATRIKQMRLQLKR